MPDDLLHPSVSTSALPTGFAAAAPANEFVTTPPQGIPPPPAPLPPSRIFFGPDGLRAGWSLVIYFVLALLLIAGATFVAGRITTGHWMPNHHATGQPHVPHDLRPSQIILNEALPFLMVCLATWIMSRIEHRSFAAYGLNPRRGPQHFLAGLFWGALCLSLLVGTLWKFHLLVFDARLLHGPAILRYALIWLFGFLCVALMEEFLLRGYLQFTLARGLAGIYRSLFKTTHAHALGFWTAALLLSFLFGFGHGSNPGESPIGLLSAGLAGFVFCYSLWRTGSLWWAIGFHTTWDWAQSFLYGVADSGTMVQGHLFATHPAGTPLTSGGATGPEGSLFVLPALSLAALLILLTLRQQPQTPTALVHDAHPSTA